MISANFDTPVWITKWQWYLSEVVENLSRQSRISGSRSTLVSHFIWISNAPVWITKWRWYLSEVVENLSRQSRISGSRSTLVSHFIWISNALPYPWLPLVWNQIFAFHPPPRTRHHYTLNSEILSLTLASRYKTIDTILCVYVCLLFLWFQLH